MSKYKVGNELKIKDDLKFILAYTNKIKQERLQDEYRGRTTFITHVFDNGQYKVDIDSGQYRWTNNDFEGLAKNKYVKCIDNICNLTDKLELHKIYKVISEYECNYELEGTDTLWGKSRFEEILNSQNPVKSSVSEPLKSNKMELLMPILDIIERLQELEIDKSSIDDIVSKIESEETKQEEIKYYENKITILEEENSKLQKENTFLYSYITKISEMTRTCIIDRL